MDLQRHSALVLDRRPGSRGRRHVRKQLHAACERLGCWTTQQLGLPEAEQDAMGLHWGELPWHSCSDHACAKPRCVSIVGLAR
jgi:hypothetical protein